MGCEGRAGQHRAATAPLADGAVEPLPGVVQILHGPLILTAHQRPHGAHEGAEPSGAERRYRKKSFRVKGVIARFEPLKFVRKYHVILESPDRLVSLVVVFDYLNEWRAVYTTQRGQTLVAKIAENQERVLMQTGQTIVLQGRCRGAGDSEIVITGSHLVP